MLPPSVILKKLLILDNLVTEVPAAGVSAGAWPCYVGHMPDTEGVPDDCVCVYDLPGFTEGRIQRTGETIEHPAAQIKVRSLSYTTAYAKARAIAERIDLIHWKSVQIDVAGTSRTWLIQAVSRTSTLTSTGNQTGRKTYNNFVFNVAMTLNLTE